MTATPTPIGTTRQGNNLVFNWTGPFSLQSSTNVNGPYSTVICVSPYTNAISAQKMFVRLISI